MKKGAEAQIAVSPAPTIIALDGAIVLFGASLAVWRRALRKASINLPIVS